MCKVLEGIHNDKLSEGLHSICRIHVTSLKQVSLKAAKYEIKKSLDLPRSIVSLRVLGRCFAFLRDQLVAQQNHLLRVAELSQICCVTSCELDQKQITKRKFLDQLSSTRNKN